MSTGKYREDHNKGLATDFILVEGKFVLSGGEPKAEDNLRMLLSFLGWFRFLVPDYIPDVLWAYQRNGAQVGRYKNVFRLNLLRTTVKYCPFSEVVAVDMPADLHNRKGLYLDLDFRYKLDPESSLRAIRFLTT